jgi:hypothetical protein
VAALAALSDQRQFLVDVARRASVAVSPHDVAQRMLLRNGDGRGQVILRPDTLMIPTSSAAPV